MNDGDFVPAFEPNVWFNFHGMDYSDCVKILDIQLYLRCAILTAKFLCIKYQMLETDMLLRLFDAILIKIELNWTSRWVYSCINV